MESVWPVSGLSTESVGSRRELRITFTPPTRRSSTVASRRRRRSVLSIIVAYLLAKAAVSSHVLNKLSIVKRACRPVESHRGAPETNIAGPYQDLILYAPRSRRRRCREGGNVGREGCPLTI